MRLSRRVESLRPSSTLAVNSKAKALKASGVDVLSFAAGEPDFDTPDVVKKAAIEALNRGMTKYMPIPGDPETRKAIADKLSRENAIPNVTADHVVISTGGKHCLYLAFQALLDAPAAAAGSAGASMAANEVLLPTPSWVSYAPMAELSGGRVVELPTDATDDFKVTPDQLRRAITPRSRIFILNSPSNPCGTMYTPAEIRALAKVIEDAARTIAPDLVIVTDEIYEKIVYAGIPHFSIGSIPAIAERTITVNGMSKAFAMTGWRVGYIAGSGEFGLRLANGIATLQGQTTTHITSFVYPAVRVALTQCAEDVERMRQAFAKRADVIFARMSKIPGLTCARPTGAFYLFPDVASHFGKTTPKGRIIKSPADFAEALLDESHVAAVPGEDFLGCGTRCVRFSFACSEEQIAKGMDRLGEFVTSLR